MSVHISYIIFVSENAYVDLLGEHDIPHDIINEHPVVDRERRDAPLPSLAERQSGSTSNSSDTNNNQRRIFEQPWVRLH